MLYQFDKYELSEQDFHLSCEPKAFRVLLLLVSNAGKKTGDSGSSLEGIPSSRRRLLTRTMLPCAGA
jgi:hypothetical protein